MIPRYSRPAMTAIWEPENRFRIWFEIEALACDALAEAGIIPKSAAKTIREKGKFEIDRIDAIERETHHDVVAFLTNLAEHIGPDARFLHQGMTSSDVLDTCLAVQLKEASDLLLADLDALLAVLQRRAYEHKHTLTIGRSHGIHAEPTTFGVKLAGFYAEFSRATAAPGDGQARNLDLRDFGRGRHLRQCRSASVEEHVAERSACGPSRSRPRSSRATATPRFSRRSRSSPARSSAWRPRSAICSAPKCARPRNIFAPGKKGSSAMPHKRNPVLSENLTGLARLVRGACRPGARECRALA